MHLENYVFDLEVNNANVKNESMYLSKWPFDKSSIDESPSFMLPLNGQLLPLLKNTINKDYYFYYLPIKLGDLVRLNVSHTRDFSKVHLERAKYTDKLRKDITEGKAKIILDMSSEGVGSETLYFPELFRVFEATPKDIIYLTGDRNESANNLIPTKFYNYWERWSAKQLSNPDNIEHYNKIKDHIRCRYSCRYKAVSMNRVTNPHRIALANAIHENGWKNKINYSFGYTTHRPMPMLNFQGYIKGLVRQCSDEFGLDYDNTLNWIKNHGVKNLDGENDISLTQNQILMSGQIYDVIRQAYFQIITETNCHNSYVDVYGNRSVKEQNEESWLMTNLFQTEKTYKAILTYKPFVILGQPGMIRALEDDGYDVFRDWIDHSYDQINDTVDRYKSFLKEVDRLIHISDDDWRSWSRDSLSRFEHNRIMLKHSGSRKVNGIHTEMFHKPLYQFNRLNWSAFLH